MKNRGAPAQPEPMKQSGFADDSYLETPFMNDDQKWLEAAAGIQEDIRYLEAALRSCSGDESRSGIVNDIEYLKVAWAVYRKNAVSAVPWPSPDDLFCIQTLPCGPQQISTGTRHDFRIAS